ncbi:hypothetical protein [Legionella cardiaca]|uniref:Uncharacterized protein n=1 Tax=Legionella cardiaca TaxID=1071983 RepID=A0ABY8AU71_9GAMM|nr:hypothetical protein [Legionella cardiaca]WED44038.1 hypothetical protein PXX05_04425 [Legionella cardiaca]
MPEQHKHSITKVKENSSLTSTLKKFKNRFFKSSAPDYSPLITQYSVVKGLLSNFLLDEKKEAQFKLAIEKLDYLLLLIEKFSQNKKANTSSFQELAAQSYYLRASCSLMQASQYDTEQIQNCTEGTEYMNLAIQYGLSEAQQTHSFERYAKRLQKKHDEFSQVLESYEAKRRAQKKIPNKKILLANRVREGLFIENLAKIAEHGFTELNIKIHHRAKKMMEAALSNHLVLEDISASECKYS